MLNATLPAPRPGPTLDRCTQTPSATPVYRGYSIDVREEEGRFTTSAVKGDNEFSFDLGTLWDTPDDAAKVMRNAVDLFIEMQAKSAAQDAVFARINADAPDLRSRIAGMEEEVERWDGLS